MTRVGLVLVLIAAPVFAGASGWHYWVPYQDPATALNQLRWDVFKKGDYYKLDPKKKPKSPDEALRLSEEDGTHSIIDIQKVSQKCDFGAVCPLPPAELTRLFGTTRPRRAQVQARDSELQGLLDRWKGVYVIVYEAGQPKWIYFGGHSGD